MPCVGRCPLLRLSTSTFASSSPLHSLAFVLQFVAAVSCRCKHVSRRASSRWPLPFRRWVVVTGHSSLSCPPNSGSFHLRPKSPLVIICPRHHPRCVERTWVVSCVKEAVCWRLCWRPSPRHVSSGRLQHFPSVILLVVPWSFIALVKAVTIVECSCSFSCSCSCSCCRIVRRRPARLCFVFFSSFPPPPHTASAQLSPPLTFYQLLRASTSVVSSGLIIVCSAGSAPATSTGCLIKSRRVASRWVIAALCRAQLWLPRGLHSSSSVCVAHVWCPVSVLVLL